MRLETETHAGMEFVKPTWDTDNECWFEDQAVTDRCLATITEGLTSRGVDPDAAIAELATAELGSYAIGNTCRTFWGSHGCLRVADHDGLCLCAAGHVADGRCSAIYKLEDGEHCVIFWQFIGDDHFTLSAHLWTWFV